MSVDSESYRLGDTRSVIREVYEYGVRLKEAGQKVYDFSLGNPSVPPPEEVLRAMGEISAERYAHAYTTAAGDAEVRRRIAEAFNLRYGDYLSSESIYLTVGAAAGLSIVLHALRRVDGEVLGLVPYFTEYKTFVEYAGLRYRTVPPLRDMTPDMGALSAAITEKTVCLIVNTPSNPSGVVYGADTLREIARILGTKSKEYGRPIYIISDEPYREICFDGVAPLPIEFYNDTIICYSYSKSFSLPGERIGYLAVSNRATERADVYKAIMGAGRALGYVCAPSLMQYVVGRCAKVGTDVAAYKRNAKLLYDMLTELGFECVEPQGAFYLLVRSPSGSGAEMSERAKRYGIILVDGVGFGIPEYVRLAYCVDGEVISDSRGAFEALSKSYK